MPLPENAKGGARTPAFPSFCSLFVKDRIVVFIVALVILAEIILSVER